ncbi:MAG: ribonuclease HII [Candidatus Goldbacteria bacterium]|nr:ribonuclease HII [Candidatus Goldiibacteriota bacterium]HPD18120.1 ribonuclease HII [Candidatus Goldiibacteriota bacterium]
MKNFEKLFRFDSKYDCVIAGVDEAGRGPWAGPVVAASVILRKEKLDTLKEVDDSKKLSEKTREKLYQKIIDASVCFAISEVSHNVIDRENILSATITAMCNCIHKLTGKPEIILVDGNMKFMIDDVKTEHIIDGDQKSLSIAAASVLAKVHRDRIMRNYHKVFPQYGFIHNKGYGTQEHIDALVKYGPCEIHRKSYKPVENIIRMQSDVKTINQNG